MLRTNSCIKQTIPRIQQGTLNLKFKWAAKRLTNFNVFKSYVEIYVNQNLQLNKSTTNYL